MLRRKLTNRLDYDMDQYVVHSVPEQDIVVGISHSDNERLWALITQYGTREQIPNGNLIDCYHFVYNKELHAYSITSRMTRIEANQLEAIFINIR